MQRQLVFIARRVQVIPKESRSGLGEHDEVNQWEVGGTPLGNFTKLENTKIKIK